MNHEDTKARSFVGGRKKLHRLSTITAILPEAQEKVISEVVDSIFSVHSNLGAGLLESVYEECLILELEAREIPFRRQLPIPIQYMGRKLSVAFRLDLLVADFLVIELKAVENLLPVHEAQLLTYLKLASKRVGLLVNFNVPLIKDGIHRLAK